MPAEFALDGTTAHARFEEGGVAGLAIRLAGPLDAIRRAKGLSRADGEDALSETVLSFLVSRDRIHQPEGWLLTVFRNECTKLICRRFATLEREESYALRRSSAHHEACPTKRVLDRQIATHLEALSEGDRSLLRARYIEGRSLSALAADRRVKPTSMKNAVSRALARLRAVAGVVRRPAT